MSASRSSLVDHAAEDSDDEEERLLQQLKALKLRKRKEAERNKRIEALRKQIEDEEAEILASSVSTLPGHSGLVLSGWSCCP